MIFTGLEPAQLSPDKSSYDPSLSGVKLEDSIVRTLRVDGRHSLSRELFYTNSVIADGGTFKRYRWPVRDLAMTLLIRASSSAELLTKIDLIVATAAKEPIHDIHFADTPYWHYYGTFKSFSITDETSSHQVQLRLEFTCGDPLAYKLPKDLPAGKSVTIPNNPIGQATKPRIKFTATSPETHILNTTRNLDIHLINLVPGKLVDIDLTQPEPAVKINGNVNHKVIAFTGDFGNFVVAPGDVITSPDTITITYREAKI